MSDRPTSAHHDSQDEILAALEGSARILDADPDARPTPAFRARGRAALLRAAQGRRAPETHFLRYRLAGLGLAAFLFLAVAYPAVAGPGAIIEGVSSAASTVGQLISLRADDQEKTKPPKAQGKNAPTPTATPAVVVAVTSTPTATATATATGTVTPSEPVTVADHPANHGAAVSEIAHATPEADQNHGEQVREVARDNHGQSVSATAQAQAEERRDEKQDPNVPAAKDAPGGQGRGQDQSQDQGQGREKATQNQGNGKKAPGAAPTATPTMTPVPAPGVTIKPGPPADTKGGGSPKNGS